MVRAPALHSKMHVFPPSFSEFQMIILRSLAIGYPLCALDSKTTTPAPQNHSHTSWHTCAMHSKRFPTSTQWSSSIFGPLWCCFSMQFRFWKDYVILGAFRDLLFIRQRLDIIPRLQ